MTGVAGVSSRICTVTKISRSWTYTDASSLVCTFPFGCKHRCGFLDFRRVSSSAEHKSFLLSMRTDAPESTTNWFSLLWFLRRVCPHYPSFGRRIERGLVLYFELIDTFRQIPGFSAGALVSWSVLSSNLGAHGLHSWGSHFFLDNSLRWTLSFPNFCVVPRALGEFDGAIWSQKNSSVE